MSISELYNDPTTSTETRRRRERLLRRVYRWLEFPPQKVYISEELEYGKVKWQPYVLQKNDGLHVFPDGSLMLIIETFENGKEARKHVNLDNVRWGSDVVRAVRGLQYYIDCGYDVTVKRFYANLLKKRYHQTKVLTADDPSDPYCDTIEEAIEAFKVEARDIGMGNDQIAEFSRKIYELEKYGVVTNGTKQKNQKPDKQEH